MSSAYDLFATNMFAHLEYRRVGGWQGFDNGTQPPHDFTMFMLLTNLQLRFGGRNDQALVPPRGIPRDIDSNARWRYLWQVAESDESLRQLRELRLNAIALADAERWVASGSSTWWASYFPDSAARFVSDPAAHSASWLTTAEFREVVAIYDLRAQAYATLEQRRWLDDARLSLGKAKYRRRLATVEIDAARSPLDAEYRMLLAAMEAGETYGREMRLVFWFHG